MSLLLVRHARAGDRSRWRGDDRERPLDEVGIAQARGLVELLGTFTIEAILSSPYHRCLQTVEPLAAARDLVIEARDELGEEHQLTEGVELVQSLAGRDVVVCGHGGLESALVDPPRWRKGETFVADERLRVVATFRPRAA
jgi:phosphohistidine phosphatase SixA